MERSELIHAVQVKVDELTPFEGLAIPIDGDNDKPVDLFIDRLLDEAAREVLKRASLSLVTTGSVRNEAVDLGDGSGYVVVPEDFLRLVRFKMAGWKRSVSVAVEFTDPVYRMQFDEFDRGGVAKPVCAVGRKDGRKVLEYFSVKGEPRVEIFEYVPALRAEEVGADLTDALTWMCAGKVLQITGSPLAETAYKTAMDLLV